jgi:hypothetical protein
MVAAQAILPRSDPQPAMPLRRLMAPLASNGLVLPVTERPVLIDLLSAPVGPGRGGSRAAARETEARRGKAESDHERADVPDSPHEDTREKVIDSGSQRLRLDASV